jgi:hypothetical protein
LKTSTVPVYVDVVVVDAEVVGAPVDERVGVCEPGFSKKEVVILEGVDQGIEGGRVLLLWAEKEREPSGRRMGMGEED